MDQTLNRMNPLKKDNLLFGLTLGLLTPVLGCALYFLLLWAYSVTSPGASHIVFTDFIKSLFETNKSSILSVSVLANLPAFFWYLNRERHLTARGLVMATMLYGIAVFITFWL